MSVERPLVLLQQALGVGNWGRGKPWKNHLVTPEDSPDFPICQKLTLAGMMRHLGEQKDSPIKNHCFMVTKKGRGFVEQHKGWRSLQGRQKDKRIHKEKPVQKYATL